MKRKKVGVEGLQPKIAIDFSRGFFGAERREVETL